jgi:hypothetical protein
MNRYGQMALRHMEQFRPAQYRQIDNPGSYFDQVGREAAAQIDQLAESLAGPTPTGEGYLERTGRLTGARRQAEEIVLAELVYLPPEANPDDPTEARDSTGAYLGWAPGREPPELAAAETEDERQARYRGEPPPRRPVT